MDNVIQFNTGKTDILFVKVPKGNEDYEIKITEELEIQLVHIMGDVQSLCACPEGNWQPVGNPFELSEEQWKSVLPNFGGKIFDKDPKDYPSYQDFAFLGHPFDSNFFETAKESGLSLLNHLKVYRENPMGSDEPDSENYVSGRQWNHFLRVWRKLEERTGNWILLTAVKA